MYEYGIAMVLTAFAKTDVVRLRTKERLGDLLEIGDIAGMLEYILAP